MNRNAFVLGGNIGGGDDLCNVCRLVTDALHVGDHFQRRGNDPEVPRHRLLAHQQLEAQAFDIPFVLVDLRRKMGNVQRQAAVALQQRLGGKGNGFFTQAAHSDHFLVQRVELLVKSGTHIIQTSR